MEIFKWEHPHSYAGDTFYDYYVGPGRSRDSEALEESNFAVALTRLGDESDTVRVVRAGHWAVGWVETILVHESDTKGLAELQHIADDLESYPILDEEHYSNLEV